jgi:hypothetical protein
MRRMLTPYTVDASLPADNASPFELLDLTGIVAKVPVKYLFVMLAQERRFQIIVDNAVYAPLSRLRQQRDDNLGLGGGGSSQLRTTL